MRPYYSEVISKSIVMINFGLRLVLIALIIRIGLPTLS